jgi:hypothetical protein
MKHYVFCSGYFPENDLAIQAAKNTIQHLQNSFCLDEDIVNCTFHSNIETVNGTDNFEVYLENGNTIQLINDCMDWAVEYCNQKWKLKNK